MAHHNPGLPFPFYTLARIKIIQTPTLVYIISLVSLTRGRDCYSEFYSYNSLCVMY